MPFIVLNIPAVTPSAFITIGHDNHIETATITASSTETGFDPTFVGMWTLHDAWQSVGFTGETLVFDLGVAKSADYLGIMGHNLSSAGSGFFLEKADSLSGPWTTVLSKTPTSDNVIFERFTSTSSRYWRLRFENGTLPLLIPVVSLGVALEMQRGMAPGFSPPLVDVFRIQNSETDRGLFIGRSLVKEPQQISFNVNLLSSSFIRQQFIPFLEHAQRNPFFFSWNHQDFPEDAVVAWTRRRTALPSFQDVINYRIRIPLNALRNTD